MLLTEAVRGWPQGWSQSPECRDEVIPTSCLDLIFPRCSEHCRLMVLEKIACHPALNLERGDWNVCLSLAINYEDRGRELLLMKTLIYRWRPQRPQRVLIKHKTGRMQSSRKAPRPVSASREHFERACSFAKKVPNNFYHLLEMRYSTVFNRRESKYFGRNFYKSCCFSLVLLSC